MTKINDCKIRIIKADTELKNFLIGVSFSFLSFQTYTISGAMGHARQLHQIYVLGFIDPIRKFVLL